jgi:hypothetical protein
MTSIPAEHNFSTRKAQNPPLPRVLVAIGVGLVLFVFLSVIALLAFEITYAGRIYPGVSVAGVDLSGMEPDQAAIALEESVTFPSTGRIVFQDREQVWVTTPAELGLQLDVENSTQAAYTIGRAGNPFSRVYAQFQAWYYGVNFPPLMRYDEHLAEAYLQDIADQVDRPTVEASLTLNGTEVIAQPGNIGRTLDIPATLASLESQMSTMRDGMIPLEINETAPDILDASQGAAIARQILSAPLTLQVPGAGKSDPGPWTFSPEKLTEMLAFEKVETEDGATLGMDLLHTGFRPQDIGRSRLQRRSRGWNPGRP